MLFQVAANQFLVVKKTWPNLFILSAGAIINVILNLFLIPRIGIEGAAIATLVGYVISDIICVIVLEKMSLMKISMDFLFTAILMMISMIIWRLCLVDSTLTSIIGAIIFCLCVIIIYRKDVKRLYCLIRSKAG
jgi:O-antigen/teichoic acid export membrane protein